MSIHTPESCLSKVDIKVDSIFKGSSFGRCCECGSVKEFGVGDIIDGKSSSIRSSSTQGGGLARGGILSSLGASVVADGVTGVDAWL